MAYVKDVYLSVGMLYIVNLVDVAIVRINQEQMKHKTVFSFLVVVVNTRYAQKASDCEKGLYWNGKSFKSDGVSLYFFFPLYDGLLQRLGSDSVSMTITK